MKIDGVVQAAASGSIQEILARGCANDPSTVPPVRSDRTGLGTTALKRERKRDGGPRLHRKRTVRTRTSVRSCSRSGPRQAIAYLRWASLGGHCVAGPPPASSPPDQNAEPVAMGRSNVVKNMAIGLSTWSANPLEPRRNNSSSPRSFISPRCRNVKRVAMAKTGRDAANIGVERQSLDQCGRLRIASEPSETGSDCQYQKHFSVRTEMFDRTCSRPFPPSVKL